ncbi:chloride channel activity protein [Homalodisca vitripennis]|nr:chloride channel activity protein [Homalodisca vitripennis]
MIGGQIFEKCGDAPTYWKYSCVVLQEKHLQVMPVLLKKLLFEKVVVYCDTFIAFIPLSFVLGFYVSYIATRWWQQYTAIPWPDKVMHSLALYVGGNDTHARMIRRTLMRYLNLSLILVLRSISSAVKRRFPTMDHLVEAGFMTTIELEMFQAVPNLEFNTYWIPCTWFIALLKDTKQINRITDSQGLQTIVEEFNEFRQKCGLLWSYDWISIPLVYTQVVTLATYSFFLAALVGRQYVEETTSLQKKQFQMEIDIYIPLFTILQFFFFMGLLKVAEQLINPFGDDDEDFELNWLIDRHTKVSYLGVDTLMSRCPPLVKDKYFDDINLVLPYTGAAFAYKKKTYRGSVHNMQVPEDQQSMFLPEISEEDEEDPDSKRGAQPKKSSSFTNMMNAVSPSAGIWGSNTEKVGHIHSGNLEANFQQTELKSNSGLDKFATKAPWKNRSPGILLKTANITPLFTAPEMQQWSSHSTLSSIDSIQPTDSPVIKSTNPFDASFQQVLKANEQKDPVVAMRTTENTDGLKSKSSSRTSIPSATKTSSKIFKYSSTGNIALSIKNSFNRHLKDLKGEDRPVVKKSLSRRQSSSSGQWKGVRWKPVIADSAGDVWSDNMDRRSSIDHCTKCGKLATATEGGNVSLTSSDSTTSSFQSFDSLDHLSNLEFPPVIRNSSLQKLKSKSYTGISQIVPKFEVGSKEPLSVGSLPNICFTPVNLWPEPCETHLNLNSPKALPDQPHYLGILKKSHSTSPRTFSRLQDTIKEENETKQ